MADAMHEAMLDARQEGGSYRRIEVITGQRRRRQWTAEEKARIVAESFEEGANISEVARRHGVVRGLLTVWRRKFATAASFQARQASCRSGSLPRAVRRRQTSRTGWRLRMKCRRRCRCPQASLVG
ncbi:transposase-like protein [Bradyrhizobium elkanii]